MAIINKRRFTEYGKCITSTEPQVIALKLVRNIKDMAKLLDFYKTEIIEKNNKNNGDK